MRFCFVRLRNEAKINQFSKRQSEIKVIVESRLTCNNHISCKKFQSIRRNINIWFMMSSKTYILWSFHCARKLLEECVINQRLILRESENRDKFHGNWNSSQICLHNSCVTLPISKNVHCKAREPTFAAWNKETCTNN